MNILILGSQIGRSASGLVVEKILQSISQIDELNIYIICNENDSAFNFKNIKTINQDRTPIDVSYKLNLIFLNTEIKNDKWIEKALLSFESFDVKFDGILAFGSAYGFKAFSLAYEINKRFKIPYWLHALDPIPSTPNWGEHWLLRFSLKRYVKKFYKNALFVSASNKQMIAYQIKQLGLDKKNSYILNPAMTEGNSVLVSKQLKPNTNIKLLFLGTIYDKRNPNLILSALEKINNKEVNFSIDFYGSISDEKIIQEINSYPFSKHHGYCNNVDKLYKNYDVLIDIDADIPNDVFISSKLSNYVQVDLPILAITPKGSPSRLLLSDCTKSVVSCSNEESEIFNALLNLISTFNGDFSDRETLREKLSIKNITGEYVSILKDLYNRKLN